MLASSVIQEALSHSDAGIAVAFFYCDYKELKTQDPRIILGSLVKQIARQDEESFEKLQRFYQRHISDRQATFDFNADELRDLIIEMASNYESTMIIVDALDECAANTSLVVELLTSLNPTEHGSTIKTLFLSRNEHEIRALLESYTQMSIAARNSDLKLFVGAELETRIRNKSLRIKDQSLKEEIMDRLVEGADGMSVFNDCTPHYPTLPLYPHLPAAVLLCGSVRKWAMLTPDPSGTGSVGWLVKWTTFAK